MADDQQPPHDEDTPGVPVFGRRAGTLDGRTYRRFGVEVETDTDRWVEEFDAYLDADAGAILALMNARTELQQANASAVLLGSSLRDDDGVSVNWTFPVEPEYDDDGGYLRLDGDPAGQDPPPRYEWHDGTLLTRDELDEAIAEFDPLADGSSRRRFQWIADSPDHRIQLAALTGLSEWIIGDAAQRPTRRPSSSRRGPQQTRRTSAGKPRSGRA